jgi:hypothetical protein
MRRDRELCGRMTELPMFSYQNLAVIGAIGLSLAQVHKVLDLIAKFGRQSEELVASGQDRVEGFWAPLFELSLHELNEMVIDKRLANDAPFRNEEFAKPGVEVVVYEVQTWEAILASNEKVTLGPYFAGAGADVASAVTAYQRVLQSQPTVGENPPMGFTHVSSTLHVYYKGLNSRTTEPLIVPGFYKAKVAAEIGRREEAAAQAAAAAQGSDGKETSNNATGHGDRAPIFHDHRTEADKDKTKDKGGGDHNRGGKDRDKKDKGSHKELPEIAPHGPPK